MLLLAVVGFAHFALWILLLHLPFLKIQINGKNEGKFSFVCGTVDENIFSPRFSFGLMLTKIEEKNYLSN